MFIASNRGLINLRHATQILLEKGEEIVHDGPGFISEEERQEYLKRHGPPKKRRAKNYASVSVIIGGISVVLFEDKDYLVWEYYDRLQKALEQANLYLEIEEPDEINFPDEVSE
jgi:hypothetical protein